MEYLNNFFEKIYVISLNKDRQEILKKQLDNLGLKYEFYQAVNGNKVKGINENKSLRFTKGAIGLLKTTEKILIDAKKNNYKNILIFEDDIEFHSKANEYILEALKNLPNEWDFCFLGLKFNKVPIKYTSTLVIPTAGYCCHAYAINNTIYDIYLNKLKQYDKPIDHYTEEIMFERQKSYAVRPSMVFQKNGVSDIINGYEDKTYLKLNVN